MQKDITIEEKDIKEFKNLMERNSPLSKKSVVISYISTRPSVIFTADKLPIYFKNEKALLITLSPETINANYNLLSITHPSGRTNITLAKSEFDEAALKNKLRTLLQAPPLEKKTIQQLPMQLTDLHVSLTKIQTALA